MELIILPSDVSLLPLQLLKAGNITCCYEAGNLRYISWGDTELLRMIYSAVRDENWDTLPMEISNESVKHTADTFSITYEARYRAQGIDYKATIGIEGHNDLLRFTMMGEALSSFKKNRIGLCVLHPLSCIGAEVRVIQPGGNFVVSSFPRLISPHQPFTDMQSIEWTTSSGIKASLKLEGEVFETEDQRNWTDASFKTYSTPLKFPIPAQVNTGDKMYHSITLTATQANIAGSNINHNQRERKLPFPEIGYCRKENAARLSESEAKQLRMIPFDHIRVAIRLYDNDWKSQLTSAVDEAALTSTRLHLVAHVDERYQQITEELIMALLPIEKNIASILFLDKDKAVTPAAVLSHFYPLIKKSLTAILVGYGTDGHFADLNRNRPADVNYDFLSFSLQPQVHARDSRTILENLESQHYILETLHSFANGKPVYVSPITLNRRDATDGADERQHTNFGAFWTVMTIQCLAAASVLSFYELTGSRGLLTSESQPSPIYKLLRKIHAFNPRWIIQRFNDNQLVMDGLLLEDESGIRMFVGSEIKLVDS